MISVSKFSKGHNSLIINLDGDMVLVLIMLVFKQSFMKISQRVSELLS